MLPKATQFAVLTTVNSTATPIFLDLSRVAARQLGITLVVQQVTEPGALAGVFTAMQREQAQALLVQTSPFLGDHWKRIIELAAQQRLPRMFSSRTFVLAGALMSYGPNFFEIYRRAANFVDKIFKGAKPGDLPVEQPLKFELVVNLKTAKALGITVPQSLLLRADEVIQ